MALPLESLRVVEMCQVYAGPFAAMLLADQGANVVKLEALDGDSSRGNATTPLGAKGLGLPFLTFNRNKRSIAVDIHHPQGKEVAYKLFRQADVLLIGTRVKTRERWGFTYEDVSAINPRIIYASITGFGERGPDADLPGIDLVVQARSGDVEFRRPPDGPPPSPVSVFHFDMATSMLTFSGVLLALLHRQQTGLGQKIETSILQSAMASHAVNMTRVPDSNLVGVARGAGAPRVYRCSDGQYIFASPIGDTWPNFCRALELDELIEDPRFATGPERQQNTAALYEILARRFASGPAAQWEERLKAANEYVTLVNDMAEVHADPQVVANEMMTRFQQPGIGAVDAINRPFRSSATANEQWFRRPPPTLGEHTREVLLELGYTQDEVKRLREARAVR